MVLLFSSIAAITLIVQCMRSYWFHTTISIYYDSFSPFSCSNCKILIRFSGFAFIFFFASLFPQEVKFFTCENSSINFTERDAIAEVETRGCYAQQKQAYTVNFLVPPTPPTDSTSSKIVHVSYHLSVSMKLMSYNNWNTKYCLHVHIQLRNFFLYFHGNQIEGLTGCFHINPTIKIPITIGSYPISDQPPNYLNTIAPAVSNEITIRQQLTAQIAERASQRQSTTIQPSVPYPENGLLNNSHIVFSKLKHQQIFWWENFYDAFFSSRRWTDPPSYEQAITIGERKFAPNYPVYRRQTSYSSQNSTPVLQRHCNQWRIQPEISPDATIAFIYILQISNPFYSIVRDIES